MVLGCEMHPDDSNGNQGISLELAISETQRMDLEDLIKSGNISPGRDSLSISGKKFDSKKVYIHHGIDIGSLVIKNNDDARRNLADSTNTGTKSILLVKVIDSGGLTVPDTPEFMSDEGKKYSIHPSLASLINLLHLLRIHSPGITHLTPSFLLYFKVFGNNGDNGNLEAALSSYPNGGDQLTFIAGKTGTVEGNDPNEVALGVVEVTIPISLIGSTNNDIRNAVTTALSTQIGISLPGDYQQVMYVVEDCYGDDCGWDAYAYVNSWNSVYAGLSYRSVPHFGVCESRRAILCRLINVSPY